MEKKRSGIVVALFLCVFLISLSLAIISPSIPNEITLKCGDSYYQTFNFNEDIDLVHGISTSASINYNMLPSQNNNYLTIQLAPSPGYTCRQGDANFTFTANNISYNIMVRITEDLWHLENITLEEGEMITVGGVAEFSISTVGDDIIFFTLEGCDDDVYDTVLDVGSFHEAICDGEVVRFEVLHSWESVGIGEISIFSSESGWNVVKGRSTVGEEGDCELGLDTLGGKVKRGNIFAINTINIIDNKKVKGATVTILDQTGELSAINGVSDNTGFFSKRLHEGYTENLIVQLDKDGCEPNTQIILFEKTYNDYVDNKNKEKNSKTLNFTIQSDYKSGENLSSRVTNLLGDAIENAEVKITSPSDVSSTIKTNFDGSFSITLDEAGIWKIQVGKTDYISSELIEFEVTSSEFIIVALVDGKVKINFKEGDEIIFEMRDENGSIVTRTVTAMFGDDQIEFIDGVSSEVVFNERIDLVVPSGGGYEEYEMTLKVKESKIKIWHIILGIVILIIIAVVIAFFSKKGSKTKPKSGEIGFSGV